MYARLLLATLIAALIAGCGQGGTPETPPAASGSDVKANDPKADWPEVFRLGLFAGDDASEILDKQEPMRAYIEEQIGIPVELTTGTSYTAVIEAMRAKRVDAMEVGPFSYCLAVQEAKAEALAAGVICRVENPAYREDMPSHYYSCIFTKKGSGLTKLEDLKGQSFNFVDPASTSGHLAPKALLLKNGIDPDKDMRTVFAGSHPTSVMSVWNGKVPAGATYENNLYMLEREGQIEFCGFPDGELGKERSAEEIKAVYDACPKGHICIIAMSDPLPETPFAARSDLPESLKQALKKALMGVKDRPELIAQVSRWYKDPVEELGFETVDQYYNSVREIAKLLDLDLKELGG